MKNFDCIVIDRSNNTFEILDGTKGKYQLDQIDKCDILNEKASKKGKQEPFLALMPSYGLPTGILSTPYLFVGILIIMKDGQKLAVYTSKSKTQVGTDQYNNDRDTAKKIVKCLTE